MEEKLVLIDGRKISYYEHGEGFPFLIIHGWGEEGAAAYLKLQELLAAQGFKVFILNLPGFRGSSLPAPGWRMKNYIECIEKFINVIELEKFYLLGHSMGGAMSIRLAATHPEKIKRLVLCSPGIIRQWPGWAMSVFLIIFHTFLLGIKILRFPLTLFYNLSKKIWPNWEKLIQLRKCINWLKRHHVFFFQEEGVMIKTLKTVIRSGDVVPYLSRIKTPTLVIWAGKDLLNSPIYAGYSYIGYIPKHNYTVRFLPEVGHNIQEEAPEEVVEFILDFINNFKK